MTVRASPSDIDIIVPTLALAQRRDHLLRALESLFTQPEVSVTALVIVNGPSADQGIVEALGTDSRIKLVVHGEPDIPQALRLGRALVTAPWFGTLDDDDLLLPGALAARVQALNSRPDCDVVVSNGICRGLEGDRLHLSDLEIVTADPVRGILHHNWLLPGSWLARTERVGLWAFEGMPRHLECTFLGLSLALRCRLMFLPKPGIIWFEDSPAAAHLSEEFFQGQAPALQALKRLPLPPDVRRTLDQRIRCAFHSVAESEWRSGNRLRAWGAHVRSLVAAGGWRHLPFTRHLLRSTFR